MKSKFILAAVAVLFTAAAHGQLPAYLQQLEVGYGISKVSGDYKIMERGISDAGVVKDTTITTSIKTKAGFTYSLGTSFQLKRLGTKSTLALGVTGMYSAYLWDFGVPTSATISDTGFRFGYSDLTFGGISVTAGAAITADIKFGVDAMRDKQYRWGWTGGIGAIPSVSYTTDEGLNADYKFGVQPIIKTEVSLRAGIVMKLRLQYAFGNITFLDHKGDGYFLGSIQQTQIIGKSNFMVSYILMPFSFMYKKSMWYNSF